MNKNNSQKSHAKLGKGPHQGYHPRSSVSAQSAQSNTKNLIDAVVSQPNQQPFSLCGPIPTMAYPMHHNFNAFPPTLGNQQFLQMCLNRAYNPAQFPVIASQQCLKNYRTKLQNLNDNSNGTTSNKSRKAIPIIDPKTGERLVFTIDKKADGTSSQPSNKKESENTESNICVQPSTQVANSNDSHRDITAKQHEVLRTDTVCSPKNEEVGIKEMPIGRKKKPRKRNKDKQSESGKPATAYLVLPLPPTTESLTIAPTPDSKRNPSSVKVMDSEVLNTVPVLQETLSTTPQNDVPASKPTVETSSAPPSAGSRDKKNVVKPQLDITVLKYSYKKDQWSPLNPEGKKQYDRDFLLKVASDPLSSCKLDDIPNVLKYEVYKAYLQNPPTKKKKKSAAPMMTKSKQFSCGELFVPKYAPTALFSGEGATVFKLSPPPPVTLAAPTSVPVEKNSSLVPITDSEISNAVLLPENSTPQNVILSSESTSNTAFESSNASFKNKKSPTAVKQQHNTVFKYSYKEDQWSPLNPEGKKQYDREFLLQLQTHPMSLHKLSNLPNVNVIKNKARIQKLPAANILPSPLRQHLWKPLCMVEEPLNEKDKLKRSVLGVLNKLTPQKFETLLSQLKDLNIDTEEKLALVCNLIFETAIKERKFSAVYAKLCKHLALIKVPVSGKSGTQINFRKLLLTKCQEEFERDRSNELKNEETKNLEVADPHKRLNKKQKKRLSKANCTKQIEYEEKERKIKSRQLGNIRFIGELFKLNMFIEPIIHGFVRKLLIQGDNLSLECLSELFKTIGKKLDDKETAKKSCSNQMDISLAQIKSIVDKRLTSLRIRFMLQDVIDLKKNNWVPRREEDIPKTLEEIRKEAESEVCEKQQLCNSETRKPKTISQERDRYKNAELGVHNSEFNEDELEKNINSFRDGVHHNNDFEEAIRCVIEMASPNIVHMFINATINDFLERSSEARYSLGQLLSSLLKQKRISFDQYKEGFAGVLEIIEDYAQNIPLIWDYMGEILEPMIKDIENPFNLLKEVLQPCIPSEKAGILVSSILHHAAKWKGTMKVGEVWRESGLQWADIIGIERNVAEFIEKHQLEFTVNPMKVSPQIQIPVEVMKKHLLSVLEKNYGLESFSSWIRAIVSDTSDPNFVRCLVTAVYKSCLSGSGSIWELNTSKLKSRMPLISCYVSTNKKLQLQALYSAQALVNQLDQPNDLLHQIIYVLYDNDVISDESFNEWEQSDDPNDTEGKAVAIHSVKTFFTSLLEPAKKLKL